MTARRDGNWAHAGTVDGHDSKSFAEMREGSSPSGPTKSAVRCAMFPIRFSLTPRKDGVEGVETERAVAWGSTPHIAAMWRGGADG